LDVNDKTRGVRIMGKFEKIMDSFERTMAAVAFAERNDRETACWMMKPEPSSPRLRVADEINHRVVSQPELRL
jgi:hypothetical protein